MTLARLLCCTLAIAPAACATHARTESTLPSSSYELCSDPAFQCTPASLSGDEHPIQIDTNLSAPRSTRAAALS